MWKTASWLGVLVVASSAAYAGHPMLSEDTGTQGRGNYELELGYGWTRQDRVSTFLFQPQLSWGLSPAFDLILQPSWTSIDGSMQNEKGLGDTNLDFKWRFYGAAPWSIGVRAGLELPTAQHDLGLADHKVSPHGLLVFTGDFTPVTLDFNLGYSRVPDPAGARQDLLHFSAAATYEIAQRVFFVVDSAVDTNPDPTSNKPLFVALAGVIYTVRPGFDLDVGYRGGLTAVAPDRQWLLGITFRGAP